MTVTTLQRKKTRKKASPQSEENEKKRMKILSSEKDRDVTVMRTVSSSMSMMVATPNRKTKTSSSSTTPLNGGGIAKKHGVITPYTSYLVMEEGELADGRPGVGGGLPRRVIRERLRGAPRPAQERAGGAAGRMRDTEGKASQGYSVRLKKRSQPWCPVAPSGFGCWTNPDAR